MLNNIYLCLNQFGKSVKYNHCVVIAEWSICDVNKVQMKPLGCILLIETE